MSGVEAGARSLLRWFPRRWRLEHGEALVGTLLDAADAEGRDELRAVERRDLMVSALRERGFQLVPRNTRGRGAAIALGLGSALALVQLVCVEWAPWVSREWRNMSPYAYGFGPFISAGALVYLLWIAGAVLGFLRQRLAMAIVLAASIATSVVLVAVPVAPWTIARPPALDLVMMGVLAATACISPLHNGGWLRRRVLRSAGAGVAALALGLWAYMPLGGGYASARIFFDLLNALPVGLIVAAVVLVLALAGRHADADAVLVGVGPAWIALMPLSLVHNNPTAAAIIAMVAVATLFALSRSRVRLRLSFSR